MADVVSPGVRSRMMAGIRGKNTKPELMLRSGLHRAGFRFRLHDKSLPGKPDLVLPKYHAVIFAHGCFWHGHDCHLFKWPRTRDEFWRKKIARNKEVDELTMGRLAASGWRCAIVWECALKGRTKRSIVEIISECSSWLESRTEMLEIQGSGP